MKPFPKFLISAGVLLAALFNPAIAQPPPPGNYPWYDNFNSYADFGGSLAGGGWSGPVTTFSCYGNHGNGSKGMTRQFTNSSTTTFINTPPVGPLGGMAELKFDYRVVDASLYPSSAAVLPQDASIVFEISTNSGTSFSNLFTINASNHLSSTNFATRTVSLSAYNLQTVVVRITVNRGSSGDYFVDFDNFSIAPAGTTGLSVAPGAEWVWNQTDRGIFSFQCGNSMSNALVQVWSMNGTLVSETQISGSTGQFNLSNQPSGVYLVTLSSGKGFIRKKIVIP